MSSAFLEEVLSTLPAAARAVIPMVAPKIAENATFAAVANMIETLAGNEGLSVAQFITSGRALQVLNGLANNGGTPSKPDILMFRCPECDHISYEVTQ